MHIDEAIRVLSSIPQWRAKELLAMIRQRMKEKEEEEKCITQPKQE